MAPPTPTTTPMMVRFELELRPEFPESPLLLRLGAALVVEVGAEERGAVVLGVTILDLVLPLSVMKVVTTSRDVVDWVLTTGVDDLVIVAVVGPAVEVGNSVELVGGREEDSDEEDEEEEEVLEEVELEVDRDDDKLVVVGAALIDAVEVADEVIGRVLLSEIVCDGMSEMTSDRS